MERSLLQSPFPSVHFTQEECLSFQRLAHSLVDECLDEFDEYVVTQGRKINKRKWKEIKELENIAVYKQMTTEKAINLSASTSSRGSLSSTSSPDTHNEWQTPHLIAVGTVDGSLEDIMYGIVTPDKTSLRVNATYLEDKCVDSCVLSSVQRPTEKHPFQFLGIKWVVRSQESIVRPRDLVFLESTGVKARSNGERIGFWVQHSVEIPQFDELKALGIVRSRQSWVSVFRETINGEVELYMRMLTVPGGDVSVRVAVKAATNMLLAVRKLPSCAHNKKLAWLLRDGSSKRSPQGVVKSERGKHCQLCSKSVSMFGSLTTCELCLHNFCSRCIATRKLANMGTTGEVFTVSTSFCKNCTARVDKTSASDISILEYVPDAPAREPEIIETSEIFTTKLGVRRDSTQSAPARAGSYASTPLDVSPPITQASSLPTGRTTDPMYDSRRSGTPILLYEPPMHERVVIPSASPYGRSQASPYSMSPQSPNVPHQKALIPSQRAPTHSDQPFLPEDHRRALWEQMNQLRVQAEEAYWQTKRNGYEISEIHEGRSNY